MHAVPRSALRASHPVKNMDLWVGIILRLLPVRVFTIPPA